MSAKPEAYLALSTFCPGWTVRDVLAHCGSALTRVIGNRFEEGAFSPEGDDRDIVERSSWSNQEVVDGLVRGMEEAGPVTAETGGLFDAVALGKWIRAGNVREALGEPDAYALPGLELALTSTVLTSQQAKGFPCTRTWTAPTSH